jgi:hypothetical protein
VGVVELLEDRCEPNREGRGIRTMMKRLMRGPEDVFLSRELEFTEYLIPAQILVNSWYLQVGK